MPNAISARFLGGCVGLVRQTATGLREVAMHGLGRARRKPFGLFGLAGVGLGR